MDKIRVFSMSCWRLLELSDQPHDEQIPQLLVKPRFGPDAYTIFLTDLSNVWSEELDLTGIVDRGLIEESPIEVSKQDITQLAILLETVQKSLAADHGTSCRITRTDADGITLHTTISLPEPLDSLSWKFYLRKRSPLILKNELILPLLVSSHIQYERLNGLIGTVSEKDKVITRLVDQFESSNLDLAAAFPSIGGIKSGRRLVKREQAAKHVPGLQTFNEELWKKRTADLHDNKVSTLALFQEALSECTPTVPPQLKSDNENDLWWANIDSTVQSAKSAPQVKASSKKPEPSKPVAAESDTEEEETEDEFETHENFKLRSTAKHTAHIPAPVSSSSKSEVVKENVTTDEEDDDDLDAPSKSQSQSRTHRSLPPKAKSTTPESSPQPPAKAPPTQKPKGKGFRVGGKAKVSENPPPEPVEGHEPSSESGDLPTRPRKIASESRTISKPTKKSFKIGGKTKASADEGATEFTPAFREDNDTPPAPKLPKTDPVLPAPKEEDTQMPYDDETAGEKAERKRRELKRKNEELAKKQAQSKKKKRF